MKVASRKDFMLTTDYLLLTTMTVKKPQTQFKKMEKTPC
jgi:hypothetical protein